MKKDLSVKLPTEATVKKWSERPVRIVALAVVSGLIVWFVGWLISRHYDKPTPSSVTVIEQPRSQPHLESPQQAPASAPTTTSPSQAALTKKKKSPSQTTQQASARTSGPNSAAVGSIQQGPGSALSIGQQGGITAGTINISSPDVVYSYDGSVKKTSRGGNFQTVLNDPNPTVIKIRAEMAAGQQPTALADAHTLMTSDPLWATPHVLAGLCYVNLGNQEAAKSELQKAQALVPTGSEYEQDYTPHLRNLEEAIKRHEPKPPS
jgi:hypothetical protein